MKKFTYLFGSLLLAGSLVACGGGGGSETPSSEGEEPNEPASGEATGVDEVTIAIGTAAPDNDSSHYHQFVTKFQEELDANSGGAIKIEYHPNGELGGEREMIEAVGLGTLDAVITGAGPLGNFSPLANALDFPFLFRDREHAYKVLDGELGEEIAAEMEDSNLKLIVWPENGFRNLTNDKHPIITPDDLKGLKIRTQENEIHLQMFKDYGAAPTPLAFTELFSAMQQGVVDGEENPLSVIVPNKFYEVQKHITMSSHLYQSAPFIINKPLFDGLSEETQQIILDAATVARDHEREFIAQQDEEFLQTLIDNGMEVVAEEDYDREAFVEASQNVYDMFEDEYGEFLDRIRAVE